MTYEAHKGLKVPKMEPWNSSGGTPWRGAPWRSHASEFLDQSMTIPIQPNRKVDLLSLNDLILTREGRVQTCTG